jgi:hypothetical protein
MNFVFFFTPLAFANFFFDIYMIYQKKSKQGKLNPSQKSLHTVGEQEDFNRSNISEEFIK